jgi:peptidoglycan/LPS O-acetylase OafA/YrhL
MKAYRPDIDALRALSVALVVIFHVFPKYLTGGFIGVDVFFVISGYLITSNIQRSITDNKFSLLRFYQNRARRLLPVLYAVIAVSALIGLFYLTPKDYHSLVESGALSLVYVGNTYFARRTDYFGGDDNGNPLLHLWSLSVEEQFYFIWPILLIILLKYFSRYLLHICIFLVIAVCVYIGEKSALSKDSGSYFLLQYRVPELLLGAWAALLGIKTNKQQKLLSTALTLVGIVIILATAFTLSKASVFPGINALWPSIGALLVIVSANNVYPGFLKAVTVKPILWVGVLSYSIYLWHWPLLIYGKASGLLESELSYALYFIILLGLSYASWKFIEQRYRFRVAKSAKVFFLYRLLPSTLILAAVMSIPYETGLQKKLWFSVWGDEAKHFYQYSADRKFIVDKICHESAGSTAKVVDTDKCKIGANNDQKEFLLIGDSHARHFTRFFNYLGSKAETAGTVATKSSCMPLLKLDASGENNTCYDKNILWYEKALNKGYQKVYLAAYWSGYLSNDSENLFAKHPRAIKTLSHEVTAEEIFYARLEKSIQAVLASGTIPVLVEQVPEFPYSIEKCVIGNIMALDKFENCTIGSALLKNKSLLYLAAFDRIQKEYPLVERFSINDLLCSEGICSPILAGSFVYYNKDHLSYSGSEFIAKFFIKNGYKSPF